MAPEVTPEGLAARLRARRPELERAILARVGSLADPVSVGDPEYGEGLRTAVAAALAYGIAALSRGSDDSPPVPSAILDQARAAARIGVPLETVLRRYFAGYTLVGDFLVEEAERDEPLSAQDLRRALRTQAVLLDRLLVAVSDAYGREIEGRNSDGERRRARRVEMLLAGELVEATALDYELDAWHVGVVAAGPGARAALRELGMVIRRRQLVVCMGGETIWAWFGGAEVIASESIKAAAADLAPGVALALGEPAEGIEGWRRTHRQALAALPVAMRGSERAVRYAEVTLLASALRDDVLASSLKALYLDPLAQERDGGEVLWETLRAYFEADRQVSAAAASLRVSRQTVSTRLRTVEEHIGVPLGSCAADLETASHLRRLEPLGSVFNVTA